MVVDLVVVHENQDSRVTSVRPCFDFATADDISYFLFQQTATSTFQCAVLSAGLFRGKPLVIRLMIYSAFIHKLSIFR